jgi:hypothetical protein
MTGHSLDWHRKRKAQETRPKHRRAKAHAMPGPEPVRRDGLPDFATIAAMLDAFADRCGGEYAEYADYVRTEARILRKWMKNGEPK